MDGSPSRPAVARSKSDSQGMAYGSPSRPTLARVKSDSQGTMSHDARRESRRLSSLSNRKNRREEGLQKRRSSGEGSGSGSSAASPARPDLNTMLSTAEMRGGSVVPRLAQVLRVFIATGGPASDFRAALLATRSLRELLTRSDAASDAAGGGYIDAVIGEGLLPIFVTLLGHRGPLLTFEAAWCLTNVASGTSAACEAVVAAQAVPPLVGLLSSPCLEVCEQAAWAIGNIAGDQPRLRDVVLAAGACERLIHLVQRTATAYLASSAAPAASAASASSAPAGWLAEAADPSGGASALSPLRNTVWALSNTMRGTPPPEARYVSMATPVLGYLLEHIDDDEVASEACWALSYVTDGADEQTIGAVVDAGVVPRLVAILKSAGGGIRWPPPQAAAADDSTPIHVPALRAVCNIMGGSGSAMKTVVDAGILQALPTFLRSGSVQVRRQALWAVSSLAAGTSCMADLVIGGSELMGAVIDAFERDEYSVKAEAAWVFVQLLRPFKEMPSLEAASRAFTLVQLGVVAPMVYMLSCEDPSMLKLILESIGTLLSAGAFIAAQTGITSLASSIHRELPFKHSPTATRAAAGVHGRGKPTNPFICPFEEADGPSRLEALLEHPNGVICELAEGLIDEYFDTDVEDLNDGILLPAVSDGGATYAFGVRRPPPIDTSFAFGAVPAPFCVPGHVRPACTPACPSAAQSSSAASTDYEYEDADDGDLDAAAGAGRRLAAGCYGSSSREAGDGGGHHRHPMGWRVSLATPGASGAPHRRSYPSPMQ